MLGGWLPRRWIIQTVITVIIPETRHWTKTAIERTATTSDCDHDHDADDQPRRRYGLALDCQFREPGNQPERHVPS